MKRSTWRLTALALAIIPTGVPAVVGVRPDALYAAMQSPADDQVREGQRIFQRKCALCHVSGSASAQPYGVPLGKARIEANEARARETIANGTARMPGWKLTLQPHQIEAIIAYLKTIDRPSFTIAREQPDR